MPSSRHTRIEITQEAYMGLEAEAVLRGMTLKRLASQLILRNISSKALQFINSSLVREPEDDEDPSNGSGQDVSGEDSDLAADLEVQTEKIGFVVQRPRISDNSEVLERIKLLWSQEPRPSQREIARIINYPASSTKYQIRMMLEKGELE